MGVFLLPRVLYLLHPTTSSHTLSGHERSPRCVLGQVQSRCKLSSASEARVGVTPSRAMGVGGEGLAHGRVKLFTQDVCLPLRCAHESHRGGVEFPLVPSGQCPSQAMMDASVFKTPREAIGAGGVSRDRCRERAGVRNFPAVDRRNVGSPVSCDCSRAGIKPQDCLQALYLTPLPMCALHSRGHWSPLGLSLAPSTGHGALRVVRPTVADQWAVPAFRCCR